jgi:hypothetical protein
MVDGERHLTPNCTSVKLQKHSTLDLQTQTLHIPLVYQNINPDNENNITNPPTVHLIEVRKGENRCKLRLAS